MSGTTRESLARRAQPSAWAAAQAHRTTAKGHTHQVFQQLRHIRVGQAKVAVSPLRFDGNQAGIEHLFADYRLRVAEVRRDYGLRERDQAP